MSISPSLETAKALLTGETTCVLIRDEEIFSSTARGVAPLLQWLDKGKDFHGFSCADKVVGKAAAFLYVLLGVKEVYANVVSESAEKVFLQYNVPLFYQTKVPAIRNRTNTGFCPMEQSVLSIDDPLEAKIAIENTLQALRTQK